jgi:hypothetical protein
MFPPQYDENKLRTESISISVLLQLPVKSVSITTKVAISNTTHEEV